MPATGIFGNGNQIIDLKTGKEIYKKLLTLEEINKCISIAKENDLHVHIYTDKEVITEKLEYMDLRNYVLKANSANNTLKFNIVKDILKYIETNKNDIFSMVISTENSSLQELQTLLSINKNIDFAYINKRGKYRDTIIDKDYEYINITPTNINKSEALKFLSNYLKLPNESVVAIGDNVNDYEMIKNAGIGVAIGGGWDELKNVAKYVTEANVSDGGFAEAIYKFV